MEHDQFKDLFPATSTHFSLYVRGIVNTKQNPKKSRKKDAIRCQCQHHLTLKNPDGKIQLMSLALLWHTPETLRDFCMVCPHCVSTEVSREREIGVLMQACFIPQQDKTLRVQSCLCAANCYSDVPPLRLDIRPYCRDIWQDIPLHTTDSRSEEPWLLCHYHKWIRIMGGVLGAWLEHFHPHISMEEDLKRKLSCVKHLILNNATQTLEIFHFSSRNVIWDHQVLTCFPVMTVIWRWVWFSPVF